MNWIAIAGSWRKTNQEIELKVRKTVKEIILRGDGIVSGGALGVDYFSLDEAMKRNLDCKKIKIFLPSNLEVFSRHFYQRADEGVIGWEQARRLIAQLKKLKEINPEALIENQEVKLINQDAYYARILQIINQADGLIAFQVNKSAGVQYTINQAKEKGLPIKVYSYRVS